MVVNNVGLIYSKDTIRKKTKISAIVDIIMWQSLEYGPSEALSIARCSTSFDSVILTIKPPTPDKTWFH
jgi:hypothetical protein